MDQVVSRGSTGQPVKEQEAVGAGSLLTLADLIVGLKEHVGLLFIAMMVFAGAAYGFLQVSPRTYTSTATLAMTTETAQLAEALMRSPVALDLVLSKFPNLPGAAAEERRHQLESRFVWVAAPGFPRQRATLFHLRVKDQHPARAKAIADALIDTWFELSKPRPDARARLESVLQIAQTQLESANLLIQWYERDAKAISSTSTPQGELAGPLTFLISQREKLNKTIIDTREALRGLSRDVILGSPTLPVEADIDRHALKLLAGSGLAGGALALLFILLRLLARGFRMHPDVNAKLNVARWGVVKRRRDS
jgi:hypothetical protein